MAMECSRFKCFRRLYAVSIPLIMMKGSVYRLAALAITVHGLPSFYSGTDSRGSYYYSPNYINYLTNVSNSLFSDADLCFYCARCVKTNMNGVSVG